VSSLDQTRVRRAMETTHVVTEKAANQ